MAKKTDCLICGAELIYSSTSKKVECIYCKHTFESDVTCKNGHYVCDSCHRSNAEEIILKTCLNASEKNPFILAETLMKHPTVHMHGPEHHFLVPAVLITSYLNTLEQYNQKEENLNLAKKRAGKILGGFCGSHGVCGAAIGTGIFVSIITSSTPLSKKEWHLSNLVTAQSLLTIANHGGPRCCKRNSFLAICTAIDFVKDHFGVNMPYSRGKNCSFSHLNNECIQEDCPYF